MEVSRHWYLALKVLTGVRNLSAEELGARADVHPNSVRKYLREPSNFEIATLEKLLLGLDVDIFDLALVMTWLKKLDKEAESRPLPLFEIAEPVSKEEEERMPPGFLRVFSQVKWLYEEMQRQVRDRARFSSQPRRFDITGP